MSRTLTVGRLLPLAFALIVAGWALAPSPAMAGVAPAPASSTPPWMDPTGARKGYCHCGCGPATCHTSADCGGASCDPFPSCC